MRLSTFYLAERFGKLVHEVEESLTSDELAEYLAYFKIKHAEELKATKKSPGAPKRRR